MTPSRRSWSALAAGFRPTPPRPAPSALAPAGPLAPHAVRGRVPLGQLFSRRRPPAAEPTQTQHEDAASAPAAVA